MNYGMTNEYWVNCVQIQVSREIWKELGKMGFLGISLPAEKGGVGGTFLDEAIVLEEQVLFIIYPMPSSN